MQNAAASTITLYPPHETQDKNPTKKGKKKGNNPTQKNSLELGKKIKKPWSNSEHLKFTRMLLLYATLNS